MEPGLLRPGDRDKAGEEDVNHNKVERAKRDVNDESLILISRKVAPSTSTPTWRTSSPATPMITQSKPGGSSSRPLMYLLGQLPVSFKYAKIPTSEVVLGRYVHHLESRVPKEAADETRKELKDVWLHHFGPRLVEGREFGIEDVPDKSKMIVKTDRHIDDKIRDIWKDWVKLEKESRKPARASSAFFMDKEDRFKKQLKMPFNISIVNAEVVIRDSGIKDWQEEAEYLRNQLSEGQPGCLGHVDKKQKKRDTRIINSINEHSFSK